MKYKVSAKKRLMYMRHMNKLRYLENRRAYLMHILSSLIPILLVILFITIDIRIYVRNYFSLPILWIEIAILLVIILLFRYISLLSTGESYDTKEETIEFVRDGFIYSYLDAETKKSRQIVSLLISYREIKSFVYNDYTGFIRMIGRFPYTYYINGHIREKKIVNEIVLINDFEMDVAKVCKKHGVRVVNEENELSQMLKG